MDFDKVLNLRQSVRSFLDDEISKNDVEYILKAGKISAVARGLYDDYKLFVIKGKKLDELQHFMELNSPRKDCTFGAPLVIVLCTKEDENPSMQQTIGCIIEQMHLAATNLNLGSVYVRSIYYNYSNSEGIKKIIDFKEWVPEACLCIGKAKDFKFIDKKHDIKVEEII